jgi:Ca2+/Na+ antiporter
VLLPESLAALRAARFNRLQTSLNLALGSALASIGLTIPAVALVALATGWTLVLGLDLKGMVLLALSLLVATLSLGTGRTTVLQGAVHLVIFAVYLVHDDRAVSLQKRAGLPVISATRLKKARLRGALMRQSTGTLWKPHSGPSPGRR